MDGKKQRDKTPFSNKELPPGRRGPAGRGRRLCTEIIGETGYDRKQQKQQDRDRIQEDLKREPGRPDSDK